MKINEIRRKIDIIDKNVINLLFKRKELARKISKIKKSKNMEIVQKDREKEVIEKANNCNERYGKDKLSPLFINNLFKQIIKESRKVQRW
jgi:chorismate mutase